MGAGDRVSNQAPLAPLVGGPPTAPPIGGQGGSGGDPLLLFFKSRIQGPSITDIVFSLQTQSSYPNKRKLSIETTNGKNYSKSLDFGFRPGSFDKKPKTNRETKNITTVYTRTFNAIICYLLD